MVLDATVPADTDFVSTLAEYIRETRTEVNSLAGVLGAVIDYTEYICSGGQTSIPAGGAGLSDAPIEVVWITGAGAADIEEITGATEGDIKIFIIGDANVTFSKDNTKIALNQADIDADFGGTLGDILVLVNIGGDVPTLDNGLWRELWRTLEVAD